MPNDPPSPSSSAPPPGPRPIRARTLVLNTATSYLDRLIDVAVFLVIIPYVLHLVGKEQYGLWTLVWAAVAVLRLVDMGFGASVVKYVADARGRGEPERLRRLVCTLFWVFVAQTAILSIIIALLYAFFGDIFAVSADNLPIARVVLLVTGGGFALMIPLSMFRGVLVGHQKLWVANVYKIIGTLIYFGVVPLAMSHSPDLRTFALVSLIAACGPPIALAIHVLWTIPDVSLRPRYFNRSMLREIWSFSFYYMLIQVASLIATRVDAFVINAVLPLGAVAMYGLAMRVSDRAYDFCAQIGRTLSPVVAELHGSGEQERLKRLWLGGTKISTAFAAPLLIGCAILAEPLIVHWAGPQYMDAATVLQFLLASNMVGIAHASSQDQLGMRGQQRYLSVLSVLGQLINLGLSIALVHVWGIKGVALATLSAPLLVDMILLQRRVRAMYAVSFWRFYGGAMAPSLIPAGVMSAFLLLWQHFSPIGSLFEVGLAELSAICLFWLLYWFLGLTQSERQRATAAIRRRLSRGRC